MGAQPGVLNARIRQSKRNTCVARAPFLVSRMAVFTREPLIVQRSPTFLAERRSFPLLEVFEAGQLLGQPALLEMLTENVDLVATLEGAAMRGAVNAPKALENNC